MIINQGQDSNKRKRQASSDSDISTDPSNNFAALTIGNVGTLEANQTVDNHANPKPMRARVLTKKIRMDEKRAEVDTADDIVLNNTGQDNNDGRSSISRKRERQASGDSKNSSNN
ncbi:hypothetical protein H0H92_015474, partial [Tricholoma furcatifolium]